MAEDLRPGDMSGTPVSEPNNITGARAFRWFAAQFAVIVIGVLTALAVNGWAEDRRDAHLEQEYLARMSADLSSNIKALKAAKLFYERVNSRSIQASAVLSNERPSDDAERDLIVLYQASRGELPDLVDVTYQELISTGGLRLIRDVKLRETVVRAHLDSHSYVSEFSAWRDREAYRNRVRRLMPADMQAAIARSCRLGLPTMAQCHKLVPQSRAEAVLKRIASDPNLKDDLTLWIAAQANIRAATDGQLNETEKVLAKLRAHILTRE